METNVIEWINADPILIQNACTFRKGGRFARLKEWLWWRWSDRYFYPARKIHRAVIRHEAIGVLVSKAMNRLRLRPGDIECIIIGPRQAFDIKEQYLQTTMCFSTRARIGFQYEVYGIKVRIVRWFDGVLILPKEKNSTNL